MRYSELAETTGIENPVELEFDLSKIAIPAFVKSIKSNLKARDMESVAVTVTRSRWADDVIIKLKNDDLNIDGEYLLSVYGASDGDNPGGRVDIGFYIESAFPGIKGITSDALNAGYAAMEKKLSGLSNQIHRVLTIPNDASHGEWTKIAPKVKAELDVQSTKGHV